MTVKQTVEITNKLGMHAGPAMKLFELIHGFYAELQLLNEALAAVIALFNSGFDED